MLPSSSLTVPDVQFSRFRFFTRELRSRRCSDGRSGLRAKGDVLGAQRSGSIGAGSGDPAATAISARSSRPDRRTNLFVESCPICRSRHSGPASSRSDGRPPFPASSVRAIIRIADRILQTYARYYNDIRTLRSLDKDAPFIRPVQRAGSIKLAPDPRRTSSPLRPGGFRYTQCF